MESMCTLRTAHCDFWCRGPHAMYPVCQAGAPPVPTPDCLSREEVLDIVTYGGFLISWMFKEVRFNPFSPSTVSETITATQSLWWLQATGHSPFPLKCLELWQTLLMSHRHKLQSGSRGKKREASIFIPLGTLQPFPRLCRSHRWARVNLLFIQSHPQKLIDRYKLIECICGLVSSSILLILFNSLSLPQGTAFLLLRTLVGFGKGAGAMGS